jgi:hypothetical protein
MLWRQASDSDVEVSIPSFLAIDDLSLPLKAQSGLLIRVGGSVLCIYICSKAGIA